MRKNIRTTSPNMDINNPLTKKMIEFMANKGKEKKMNIEEKMLKIFNLARKANSLGLRVTINSSKQCFEIDHYVDSHIGETVTIKHFEIWHFTSLLDNHAILNQAIEYLNNLIEKSSQELASE